MAANPSLAETSTNEMVPAPFPGESILLRRRGINIYLDGVRTPSGKWQTRGKLYLTDVRMVFLADKTDKDSGLAGFDFPLAYLEKVRFNQPIFGANNLAGMVWPALVGGGPQGRFPPHEFILYFKEGGVGTFLPLFFRSLEQVRASFARAQQPQEEESQQHDARSMLATAFVDPNDPTQVYLSQPVNNAQQLNEAPIYAAKFGQPETYEDMGLRP